MDRLFADAFGRGLAVGGWCLAAIAIVVGTWCLWDAITDRRLGGWPTPDSTEPE